jgi:nitroreductase
MTEIPPITPRPAVLDFLLTRRSRPPRMLGEPGPGRAEIETILTAAARSPDHGKLEPWRFIVIGPAARARLAGLAEARAAAKGLDAEGQAKAGRTFCEAPVVVAVVASPKASDKIPAHEQLLSTGAVCLAALNAAAALGFGSVWLTGWLATDRPFLTEGLGLEGHETVAGFIHLGTETAVPPERPRPEVASLTEWLEQ